MTTVKQRLEKLEQSSALDGEMTHDDFVLYSMDKPSQRDASLPEITDEDIDAFLRPATNRPENSHAKP